MSNDPYSTPPPVSQNPGYQQQQFNDPHQSMQGSKHAQSSLVFGIIGLFFLGIVFGPLAIVQAKKAEAHNVASSAGKILGWIDLAFGILGIVLFIAMMAMFAL